MAIHTREARSALGMAVLLLLLARAAAAGTDEYWTYSFRNVDVTASGNGAYAVNLAHNIVRLDGLLSRILSVKSQSRLPTHIYVLPEKQLAQFLGDEAQVSYKVSRYENTILMKSDNSADALRHRASGPERYALESAPRRGPAVARGEAKLPADARTLKRRARETYERGLAADPGNLRARDELAALDSGR